jgi:hypothetical protein
VHSIGRREEQDVISAVYPDDSSEFAAKSKLAAPICETPEKRAPFEKTLVAIRDIIGDLEEIYSKRIVDELAQVEDGPWAEWGKGRHNKPHQKRRLLMRREWRNRIDRTQLNAMTEGGLWTPR